MQIVPNCREHVKVCKRWFDTCSLVLLLLAVCLPKLPQAVQSPLNDSPQTFQFWSKNISHHNHKASQTRPKNIPDTYRINRFSDSEYVVCHALVWFKDSALCNLKTGFYPKRHTPRDGLQVPGIEYASQISGMPCMFPLFWTGWSLKARVFFASRLHLLHCWA